MRCANAYKHGVLLRPSQVRFANHSHKAPNCEPRVITVRGERRVGLYVKSRPLQVGILCRVVVVFDVSRHPLLCPQLAGWNGTAL